jgi:hypothetical protein
LLSKRFWFIVHALREPAGSGTFRPLPPTLSPRQP